MITEDNVLVKPHETEKTLAQKGKYTFVVNSAGNKILIKKAIKKFYGVDVDSITITKNPRKTKAVARGKFSQRRPELVKATVTVKDGKSIDFNAYK